MKYDLHCKHRQAGVRVWRAAQLIIYLWIFGFRVFYRTFFLCVWGGGAAVGGCGMFFGGGGVPCRGAWCVPSMLAWPQTRECASASQRSDSGKGYFETRSHQRPGGAGVCRLVGRGRPLPGKKPPSP